MNRDLKIAKKTIQAGIKALKKLSNSLNYSSQFSKAVNLCSKANKIGIIGIGKSKDISLYIGNLSEKKHNIFQMPAALSTSLPELPSINV